MANLSSGWLNWLLKNRSRRRISGGRKSISAIWFACWRFGRSTVLLSGVGEESSHGETKDSHQSERRRYGSRCGAAAPPRSLHPRRLRPDREIGRASCRERG